MYLCKIKQLTMRKKDKLYTIKQPINLYNEGGDTKNTEDTEESTLLEALTNGNGFDLKNLFCKGNNCTIKIKGCNVYSDVYHLTSEGSSYVAPFIAKEIENFQK